MTVFYIWGGLTLTAFIVYGCVAAIQWALDRAFPSRRVQARRATPPYGAAHRAPRAVPAHGRTAQARHPRRPAPTPPTAA